MLSREQCFPLQKCTKTKYRRFLIPAAQPATPMPPGLFKATYGPHGVELVMVEVPEEQSIGGMRAVKITCDPNVPFDKVTFEMEDSRCLNLPLKAQESCQTILRAMEAPQYVDFQVPDNSPDTETAAVRKDFPWSSAFLRMSGAAACLSG